MDDLAAVVFDLDGTLCLHDQDPVDLWARAFERAGVDVAVDPAAVAAVDPGDTRVVESPRAFFAALFTVAAEEAGVEPETATVEAVAAAYHEAYDPTQVSFRPGARAALAAARERHPVGLVTNGGRDTQRAKLASLGVADAFDVAVYCDPRAGVDPKPDPTPLLTAADRLGADPTATLVVGDSHPADVVGAHNAGMRSAWVPREQSPDGPAPQPTHRFDSMRAVATLLGG